MAILVWKFRVEEDQPLLEEIYFDGQLRMTMNDISRQIPLGGYTTFRTFKKNCALNLENHFNRLEETSKLAGSSLILPREKLRKGIRKALEIADNPDSRVRISVDINYHSDKIYLMVEPLITPPAERYKEGAEVLTRSGGRKNARAKLSNFINIAHEIREGISSAYEEVLMVNETGEILEGLTSNFFGIDQQKHIRTANLDVLMGITRSIVIDLAINSGFQIDYSPIKIHELESISEAFITSSSRGILPVRKIDNKVIGNGRPGEITRMLMKNYEEKTEGIVNPI